MACGTVLTLSPNPDVQVSKLLGESEKLVNQLFQMAREKSPSIVFIDEVGFIAPVLPCLDAVLPATPSQAMHTCLRMCNTVGVVLLVGQKQNDDAGLGHRVLQAFCLSVLMQSCPGLQLGCCCICCGDGLL